MKENEKNEKKNKLIDIVLQDLEYVDFYFQIF